MANRKPNGLFYGTWFNRSTERGTVQQAGAGITTTGVAYKGQGQSQLVACVRSPSRQRIGHH